MLLIDLSGKKFGRWTVVRRAGPIGETRDVKWLCRCSCGSTASVLGHGLRAGTSKSCGCFKSEETRKRLVTHGASGSSEYNIWCAMKRRCNAPGTAQYADYGGRGIKVCDRWSGSFENFLADMGPRPTGHTLDRKDNNGNYEPSNCRWASRIEQANNSRANRFVTLNGERMTVANAARKSGIAPNTAADRIKRGWTVESAFSTPPQKRELA